MFFLDVEKRGWWLKGCGIFWNMGMWCEPTYVFFLFGTMVYQLLSGVKQKMIHCEINHFFQISFNTHDGSMEKWYIYLYLPHKNQPWKWIGKYTGTVPWVSVMEFTNSTLTSPPAKKWYPKYSLDPKGILGFQSNGPQTNSWLGGGFKDFLEFSPENWGRFEPILTSIFFRWVGKNHQLVFHLSHTRHAHPDPSHPALPSPLAVCRGKASIWGKISWLCNVFEKLQRWPKWSSVARRDRENVGMSRWGWGRCVGVGSLNEQWKMGRERLFCCI